MSTGEASFSRIGRIEAQYSLEGEGRFNPPRPGVNIVRGKLGEATIYMTYGPGQLRDQNIIAVAPFAPDTLELRVEKLNNPHLVAALTHLALLDYVKRGEAVDVVSFVARHLDNDEADISADPLLRGLLGMEGESHLTRQGELIYRGDVRDVHGNAMHALRRPTPPLTILHDELPEAA